MILELHHSCSRTLRINRNHPAAPPLFFGSLPFIFPLIDLGFATPLAAPLAAMGFCLGSSRNSGRNVSEAVLTEMML
jgi:hypothetical protein